MVFCGNGATRDDLIRRSAGLRNVRFLDLQPQERLPELLSMADIHLLPQRTEVADLVLPSKLGAILASGRPVVAMAEPGTAARRRGRRLRPVDPGRRSGRSGRGARSAR